jgi:hypothetical protein
MMTPSTGNLNRATIMDYQGHKVNSEYFSTTTLLFREVLRQDLEAF